MSINLHLVALVVYSQNGVNIFLPDVVHTGLGVTTKIHVDRFQRTRILHLQAMGTLFEVPGLKIPE